LNSHYAQTQQLRVGVKEHIFSLEDYYLCDIRCFSFRLNCTFSSVFC